MASLVDRWQERLMPIVLTKSEPTVPLLLRFLYWDHAGYGRIIRS